MLCVVLTYEKEVFINQSTNTNTMQKKLIIVFKIMGGYVLCKNSKKFFLV